MTHRRPLALCLAALLSTPGLRAVTVTWDNGGGDRLWSNTLNWNPDQAPLAVDDLVFDGTGAHAGGVNAVTSILDLSSPAPFAVRNLFLIPPSANATHHLDLGGNTLRATGEVRVGYGVTNSVVTVSNGALEIGSATTRAGAVTIGYRGAGSVPGAVAGELRLVGGVPFTAYAGTFDIGRRFADSGFSTTGLLNLSGAGNVVIDSTRLFLGTSTFNGPGQGQVPGTLRLPTGAGTSATLITPWILVGNGDPVANSVTASEILLGPSTTMAADELTVGRYKARANLAFAAGVANGTLTLGGRAGAASILRVAYNATDTGAITEGTLNLTGGTLNATLSEFSVGVHNAGTGGARGRFIMDAGTVTADFLTLARPDNAGSSTADTNTTAVVEMNGGLLAINGSVTDGNGTSSVLVDAGVMNVGDAFKADILRVGHNNVTGRSVTGTLDVNGVVNAGTLTQVLDLGRSETPNTAPIETIVGTADFTDAPSVTLLASELRMGSISADGQTAARGVLRLAAAGPNVITTPLINVGNSGFAGNSSGSSEIHFGGATNTVSTDNFHVGHQKSNGLVDILAGGTLVLTGRTGAEANLFVGNNDNNGTGVGNTGVMDLRGATFNAALNQLVIGRHGGGAGNGKGTLRIGAGTVTARSLLIADPSFNATSTAPLNTTGLLEINGADVSVNGTVLDGGGISRLDVLAGRLAGLGNFNLDTVNVGAATGPDAVLEPRATTAATALVATTLNVESSGILRLGLVSGSNAFVATNATFAAGARVDASATFPQPVTSLLTADASTWTAGTNVWDEVAFSRWDRGLPSGASVATGATQTVLRVTGTLTDNGLVAASTNWTVVVTPGPTGRVDLVRAGPPLRSGQLVAEINTATSLVTRPGDLVVGDLAGSGAHASALSITAGSLAVAGAVLDDGGLSRVNLDGGALSAAGGFSSDILRAGYNGRTATLSAGGAIRLGTGTEIIDIGRRDTGDVFTSGAADFSSGTSFDLSAAELRLGTNTSGANTAVRGTLVLPVSGNAGLIANTITISDSSAAANPVLSTLTLGSTNTTIQADNLHLGRRKGQGRLDAAGGGTVFMTGRTTGTMNLFLGYNDITTGTEALGTLDLSGSTLNASFNQMVLGLHGASISPAVLGAGKGTFIMSAGAVTAQSVTLGDASAAGVSGTPANTTGTLDLRGGSFSSSGNVTDGGGSSLLRVAGSSFSAAQVVDLDTIELTSGTLQAAAITRANGSTTFTFSGGVLSAGTVNLGPVPLVQTGGVLAPAAAGGVTTVAGEYLLDTGAWTLEHGGFTNGLVVVNGALTLGAGSTLNLTQTLPAYAENFILARYASLNGAFAVTNGLPAGWTVDYNFGGQNRIALVQVPSPVTNLTVTVENGLVVVRWSTDDETDVLGFHVERLDASPAWQRLTSSPVPALGAPGGHSYAYTDTTAVPGANLRYRVIVVKTGNVELANGPYARQAVQEVRVAPPALGSTGAAVISWASNEGARYKVLRCPTLETPVWDTIATGVIATPPTNSFTDTDAGAERYYYRIEVE